MQTLLKSQDLWDFVEQGYEDSDEANRFRGNKKKDSKSLAIIQQVVHDNFFSRIAATIKASLINLAERIQRRFKSHHYAVDVPNDVWFVDSDCSNHMCSNMEMFKELVESRKIQVRLGDDKSIQVEEKGTVAVKDGHGNTKLIYDVYFIPHLAHNLLSVGQLISTGYMVLFVDRFCVIKEKKSGQIIAKVCMMENRMFPLQMSNVEKDALVSGTQEASRLWHLRYGHLNTNGLKILHEEILS
ncbi:hypothetical protein SASPL_105289 [Salvia splendens]|uniref:Retrovirus-related Pol polyprotein from transposon TNT 1-94-like beta-barrel domain-containing protein n=1 Tax=Salvia splendens TaxID=180675 RepID=A0A8X8YLF4_SALSN|nr:hypothetical protein SASPL_105289 [Salvia splendens]